MSDWLAIVNPHSGGATLVVGRCTISWIGCIAKLATWFSPNTRGTRSSWPRMRAITMDWPSPEGMEPYLKCYKGWIVSTTEL